MEVKIGPWRRRWRKVSMDTTPESCERPWMCTGNNIRSNNQELYRSLQRVSDTIRARRLRLAGHCASHNEKTASKVLLWELQYYIHWHYQGWYWTGQYQRGKSRVEFWHEKGLKWLESKLWCVLFVSTLEGPSQLMHMRIRYHFLADLHITRHVHARETESEKHIRNI